MSSASAPTAASADGRTFTFHAPIEAGLTIGHYVTLETPDGAAAGLITGARMDPDSVRRGSATVSGGGHLLASTPVRPFGAAPIAVTDQTVGRALSEQAWTGESLLTLGGLAGDPDAPAHLRAAGFARHTFMCGQSGSGKTYTLGVVLEQLLMRTSLRMMVLDPNSDFTGLGKVQQQHRAQPDDDVAALEQAGRGVQLFGQGHEREVDVKLGRLTLNQQAAILQLDPLADDEQYRLVLDHAEQAGTSDYGPEELHAWLQAQDTDPARRLANRMVNLQLRKRQIWADPGAPGILDQLPEDWRAIVLDLGSLDDPRDRSILASAASTYLWINRHRREPVLLVIDEAHNICPANPTDPSQAMATDVLVSIAGEGRKYGIYLLLVTQRPQKLHPNVLSQCQNLILMRMNAAGDIQALADVFSHVPADMITQSATFGLGEGLAGGRIAGDPLRFSTGRRLTPEGGGDVPTTWARTDA